MATALFCDGRRNFWSWKAGKDHSSSYGYVVKYKSREGKVHSYLFLHAGSVKGQKHKEGINYRVIFVIPFLHTGIMSTLGVTQNDGQSFPIPQVSSTFVGLNISFLHFYSPFLLFSLIFLPLFLTDQSSKNQSIQLWILCLVNAFLGHPPVSLSLAFLPFEMLPPPDTLSWYYPFPSHHTFLFELLPGFHFYRYFKTLCQEVLEMWQGCVWYMVTLLSPLA